jgi:hypothetical protein
VADDHNGFLREWDIPTHAFEREVRARNLSGHAPPWRVMINVQHTAKLISANDTPGIFCS